MRRDLLRSPVQQINHSFTNNIVYFVFCRFFFDAEQHFRVSGSAREGDGDGDERRGQGAVRRVLRALPQLPERSVRGPRAGGAERQTALPQVQPRAALHLSQGQLHRVAPPLLVLPRALPRRAHPRPGLARPPLRPDARVARRQGRQQT